jgi:hypothetical protein
LWMLLRASPIWYTGQQRPQKPVPVANFRAEHDPAVLRLAPRKRTLLGARVGSKCEELNVSESGRLGPVERTWMRRVATSLMGHMWSAQAGVSSDRASLAASDKAS